MSSPLTFAFRLTFVVASVSLTFSSKETLNLCQWFSCRGEFEQVFQCWRCLAFCMDRAKTTERRCHKEDNSTTSECFRETMQLRKTRHFNKPSTTADEVRRRIANVNKYLDRLHPKFAAEFRENSFND